jgi:NADP-dependent 3-hydroxy acid dehydrogenase YdfG
MIDDNVKGKVIVITGASSGIGKATALLLAERGAMLVLGARRLDLLKTIAAKITSDGGQAVYAQTDVKKRVSPPPFLYFASRGSGISSM